MHIWHNWQCIILAGVFAIGVGACSETQQERTASPLPPPPPPRSTAQRTYDYTHTVRHPTKGKLARKFVVALVRFGADRPPDDPEVPYGLGPREEPGDVGAGATSVTVTVQNAPAIAVGPAELPLDMSMRDRAMLKQELMESESFIVIERERVLDILREQNLGQTKYVNPETAPGIGQLMGVSYLIEASVGRNLDTTLKDTEAPPASYKEGDDTLLDKLFRSNEIDQRRRLVQIRRYAYEAMKKRAKQEQNRCGVYLSMYSVRTGELVADAFGIGPNSLFAIEDAVEDLVDECREIPNPPRIAAIEEGRIFLDVGENDHVTIGQRFRYLIPGREIRNAAGQVIGSTDEEGGELEVTRVEPLMSVAKVTREVSSPVVGGIVEPLE